MGMISKKEIEELKNIISRKEYDNAFKMLTKCEKLISDFENQREDSKAFKLLTKPYYINRGSTIYDIGYFYGFASKYIIFTTLSGSKLYTSMDDVYTELNSSTMKILNNTQQVKRNEIINELLND